MTLTKLVQWNPPEVIITQLKSFIIYKHFTIQLSFLIDTRLYKPQHTFHITFIEEAVCFFMEQVKTS